MTTVTILSETLRDNVPLEVAWMSLRQKYRKVLSQMVPAGAVGLFLLLGAAAGDALSIQRRNRQLRSASLLLNG